VVTDAQTELAQQKNSTGYRKPFKMILIIIYKDIYSLPFKRNIIDKNTRNARRA
jgi:hypothetical protein